MNRRRFLQNTSLAAGGSLLVPAFLKAFEQPNRLGGLANDEGNILVVIQLAGGNDGLNTIVPHTNDIYYRERAQIAVSQRNVVNLDGTQGLNPNLAPLKELYDQGWLSIVNSVGYPNPDRSHFRSMDIWQTASDSHEYLDTGWVGRLLDANCNNCSDPLYALQVSDTLSLALKGKNGKGLAVQYPEKLHQIISTGPYEALLNAPRELANSNQEFLYKTLAETVSSSDYLYEQAQVYTSKVRYPNTPLGKQLKTVGELICSGSRTRVYYVGLSGFDTHIRQNNVHRKLLQGYAEAVSALTDDLKKNNRLKEVAILTFSEFGRRVKQNASEGTDHGAGNNVWVISEGLQKPGIYNDAPNLADLDQEGDIKHTVDFRQVYATLIEQWLGADSAKALGKPFSSLPLFG